MLRTLKLLLPALLPSWNFFDVIAPSPRIQFSVLSTKDEIPHQWHEFRPRPEKLTFMQMLKRMLWNPKWNESLFVMSCAERIITQPPQFSLQHSENEILKRITRDWIGSHSSLSPEGNYLQFRLILIQRQDKQLRKDIVFHSRIQPLFWQDKSSKE